ncbi:hypothetical protein BDZ91DRAFT_853720 [Kalaharituber pfeilii]|nr:hypothetical protein BDZ91DRAFT_853720 [Kalaharituber pfeilii]
MSDSDLRIQRRDRDLMPEADEVLTDDKLDSLWEWFCMATNEKFQPQLIFAKLVNGARKPYRQNRPPPHGYPLFTPGTSTYTPSECTIAVGVAQVEQQPDTFEDTDTVETLQTKLVVAEDSLQAKQTIINQMEDALQTKQMLINQMQDALKTKQALISQLEDSLRMKQKVINELEKRNQEQEERRRNIEEEKKKLELNSRKRDQQHREFGEKVEEERRQMEMKLRELGQEFQESKEKVEKERRQMEMKLRELDQEFQEYKEKVEKERSQMEVHMESMDRNHRVYKDRVEGEKWQLRAQLQCIQEIERANQDKPLIQVSLRSAHHGTYISIANGRVTATREFSAVETFTLVKHLNGTVSFQTTSVTRSYLSADPKVKLRSTCGNEERFWLRSGSEDGSVFIEPVNSPGILFCKSRVTISQTASMEQLFHLILRNLPINSN